MNDQLIDEILAANPHINKEKVMEMVKKFNKVQRPFIKKGYGLATPYARRRFGVKEDEKNDGRIIFLRKRAVS